MDEDRQPVGDRRGDPLNGRATGAPAGDEPAVEPLPAALRERLDRCASDWVDECARRRAAPGGRSRVRRTLPLLAALAGVLLAVAAGWSLLAGSEATVAATSGIEQWRAERARQRILASSGAVHWAWHGASGSGTCDIVWQPAEQRGVLRLRGFVPNDPARAQYQLWIFDAARDDRYPVDGGVFDVPAGQDEVLVTVRPAVPVARVAAFAVTVERPGGVVVSDREKVVAFASAGT